MTIQIGQTYKRNRDKRRIRILKKSDKFSIWLIYHLSGDRRKIQVLSKGTIEMLYTLEEP